MRKLKEQKHFLGFKRFSRSIFCTDFLKRHKFSKNISTKLTIFKVTLEGNYFEI